MTAEPALPSIGAVPDERERTANDINALATELETQDSAVAVLLRRLGDAVRAGREEETRAYAGAVDPRALAELAVHRRSTFWALLEVARNVLVFAPIAVTWYGLSAASVAYAELLGRRPELVTRPFLLLWQEGFENAAGVLNFSNIALTDASLIGLLIVLSLVLHVRSEIRDPATRTRILLKESEIRGLIGHATSLSTSDVSLPATQELLDEMVAEERRIYERAMEREQQLFDLEGAVRELRGAAADLARVAGALGGRTTNEEEAQRLGRAGRGRL